MTAEDNGVNIDGARASYHHGDLRQALIDEGLRQLAASNGDPPSLRALARAVGVSPTAVYRHFPDKAALIHALCWEGDRMLAAALMTATFAAGGGGAGHNASGRAYVRFALDHPALFRQMMTRFRAIPGELDESAGLRLLMAGIAVAFPELSPEDTRIRALQAWSLVHGLSMLMLDGVVPADQSLIDAVISSPATGTA